jgi:hypothetical protein
MKNLDRRRWLARAGMAAAAPLGATFFRQVSALAAGDGPPPVRLIVLCKQNGHSQDLGNYRLADGPTKIPAGSALAPLAPFVDRLSVVGGMNYAHMQPAAFGCHLADPFVLSAKSAHVDQGRWDGTNKNYHYTTATPTLDRFVAQRLGPVPVSSIAIRERGTKAEDLRAISYESGPVSGKPNPTITADSPARTWELLFSKPLPAGPDPVRERQTQIDKLVATRLEVSYQKYRNRLAGWERETVEGHLGAISALKTSLHETVAAPMCQPPANVTATSTQTPEEFDKVADMLVTAMSCGITRVATFMWVGATWTVPVGGRGPATRGGAKEEHADVGHSGDESVRRSVDEWYVARYASLLAKLDKVKEGNGTMLDNSIVVLADRDPDHNSHSTHDLTWLIAGRAGGRLATGHSVRWASGVAKQMAPQARILMTLCRGMGVDPKGFVDGEPLRPLLAV